MIERHYDEEALISLLDSSRAGSDAHLLSCTDCTDKLESFRMIADAMHDRDVWDAREVRTEAIPSTIATLRAFADRMADEDTAAETLLTELLAGDRETWLPRLAQHPQWRTAGVVRKLIEAASRAIDTMPPDAVEMTALATDIAEHLDPATSPSDTIPRLRGAAWRERAYALYYTGQFSEAEAAIGAAERHFERCVASDYERARVLIVSILVEHAFERADAALVLARESVTTFTRYGDLTRLASAGLAESHLFFKRGRFDEAIAVLRPLEVALRQSSDVETHARVIANLGFCAWKLGRTDEAMAHHDSAAALFEYLGIETEAVRIRWNVAAILVAAGRFDDAYIRLESVLPHFERFGMTSEAALVRMDLAEILLVRGSYRDVDTLCATAIKAFEDAGAAHTTRALVALGYMREAAQKKTATPALARHVREYIRKLPQDHNLLFAPPPSPL